MSCDRTKETERYITLGTPVRALNMNLKREEFLQAIGGAVQTINFESIEDSVNKKLEQATTVDSSIDMQVKPRGRDNVCVYLGGAATETFEGEKYPKVMATCMTVIGQRGINANVYKESPDRTEFRTLMPWLKGWVQTIRRVN
jgi:hypothetical protein